MPVGKKPRRPPVRSKRRLINGIRRRTRTGAPWRNDPAHHGEWESVYGLLRRRQRDGTWSRSLTQLQAGADARGLITWALDRLEALVRHRLKRLQFRPDALDGFMAGTGLNLDTSPHPDEPTSVTTVSPAPNELTACQRP
ncbi:Putative transposase of IS4/5 family [Streptomyces sp. 1331.2]|nr:Putative transposase of IS4/5 family [Streptomyces sp. 1331.2]